MQIKPASKLVVMLILTSFLSACGVLAVGGVAASAAILADRRSASVQAIDKGIELESVNALAKRFGDNAHINVTSFNQKVLLTGEVKDADIKGEAAKKKRSKLISTSCHLSHKDIWQLGRNYVSQP